MYILTPKQMKELDTKVISRLKIPGIVLMENAATAVADKGIEMLNKKESHVTVFAGTGNNGGDGFAAARRLFNYGMNTVTYIFGDTSKISGDAKINYDINKSMNMDIQSFNEDNYEDCIQTVKRSDLIIDALLGTGYHGTMRNNMDKAVEIINGYAEKVLSVDIPSGVNGYDGRIEQCAVKADETVTFCLPKVGLCVYPGKQYAGKLTVADIQIPEYIIEKQKYKIRLIDKDFAKRILPERFENGNKGDYGRVMIIAGSKGMTGAACLAAKAALKTGSGLVYMTANSENINIYENNVLEAVKLKTDDLISDLKDKENIKNIFKKQDCFVIGPGMGNNMETFKTVEYFLSLSGQNIVLDADGLNVLENNTNILKRSDCNIVITPHPGEMSRLNKISIAKIQENRLECAKRFAKEYNVTVVLKGAGTVVAIPDGNTYVNSTGCPGMSTAGSGDVLSGIIGSLTGQGLSISNAATLGVYLHGLAGEISEKKFTEYGTIATDIIDMIPSVYKIFGNNYRGL